MTAAAYPASEPAVLLIDGRSGSGKTTLAEKLAARYGAQILPVEALYPGWEGLAEGSAAVPAVLDRGWYRRYDWVLGGFADRVELAPGPLIVEGCGAVTRASLAAASRWAQRHGLSGGDSRNGVRALWLELGERERRERALSRDGETFAPHWDRWAEQEAAHFAEHRPWLLADELEGRLD